MCERIANLSVLILPNKPTNIAYICFTLYQRIINLPCLTSIVKEKTGSSKGATILKDWDKYLPLFWQLVPPSEEDTPEASAMFEQKSTEEATLQSA